MGVPWFIRRSEVVVKGSLIGEQYLLKNKSLRPTNTFDLPDPEPSQRLYRLDPVPSRLTRFSLRTYPIPLSSLLQRPPTWSYSILNTSGAMRLSVESPIYRVLLGTRIRMAREIEEKGDMAPDGSFADLLASRVFLIAYLQCER